MYKNKKEIVEAVLLEIAEEGRSGYNEIMKQDISFADKMKQVVAQKA